MTQAEGGSPWAGRRRARCSGAPPPSRASRGTWATPDPRARGRYRRSSPGRRGCRRPAPRGKRGAAHRLRGRARGRVSRGRGRDGAGSAKSAMWVGIVIFLVQKASRARRKCRSRPERSDAVGGFRGSDAPAAPLAIATVTRGDVRACGVGLASGEEARAPRRDFPTVRARGGTTLDFFRQSKQSQTSTVLAVRKTRFVPFWRVSFSPTFEAFIRALGQRTRRDGVDREHAAPPRGHRRVEGRGQRLLPRGRFPQGRGRVHQGAQGTSRLASRLAFSNHANRRSADARGASL